MATTHDDHAMTADPNAGRGLTPAGANLIKHFENCLEKCPGGFRPYICPAGVLTIGWGHTNDNGRQFKKGVVWTQAECDAEFMADMEVFIRAVRRRVKVALTAFQFDAVTSFTFNCGEGNLAKSTLLRKINAEDFEDAALEFQKWNRGGGRVLNGLVRRRASEALLFQNIADANYDGKRDKIIKPMPVPMPQLVDLPLAA